MTNDMTIRITPLEGEAKTRTTLLVEGSLDFAGAQLLANVCQQAALQTGQVSIALSGVVYLDEASATLLRWLRSQPKFSLAGCSLFTRRIGAVGIQTDHRTAHRCDEDGLCLAQGAWRD